MPEEDNTDCVDEGIERFSFLKPVGAGNKIASSMASHYDHQSGTTPTYLARIWQPPPMLISRISPEPLILILYPNLFSYLLLCPPLDAAWKLISLEKPILPQPNKLNFLLLHQLSYYSLYYCPFLSDCKALISRALLILLPGIIM